MKQLKDAFFDSNTGDYREGRGAAIYSLNVVALPQQGQWQITACMSDTHHGFFNPHDKYRANYSDLTRAELHHRAEALEKMGVEPDQTRLALSLMDRVLSEISTANPGRVVGDTIFAESAEGLHEELEDLPRHSYVKRTYEDYA